MKHAYPLLLVEDHDAARRSFERLLSSAVDVVAARSCRSARSAWLGRDALAGAIIDVHLPDGSGLDLVEPLRTAYPRLRILAMTADSDVRHIERAQLLGVEFVRKPPPQLNVFTFVDRSLSAVSNPTVGFVRNAIASLLTVLISFPAAMQSVDGAFGKSWRQRLLSCATGTASPICTPP